MTRMTLILTALAVTTITAGTATAAEIILTFDDVPAYEYNNIGDVIREEYAALGVHFNSDGRHSGIVREGISQGDPGNWDLEGSNGPQFLGHNYRGLTGVIEFDAPISAFRVDAAEGFSGILNLSFSAYGPGGWLETVILSSSEAGAWETISLSVSGITRIDYTCNSIFALDNMRFEMVPEPATMGLLGLGLIGLAARRRRRG